MKKIRFINILLIVLLITGIGCDPDDNPTPTEQELIFTKLAGAWFLRSNSSILLDGQDISLNYDGFRLLMRDGFYSTTNAGDLLDASGMWTWVDKQAGAIELDDGKVVTIVILTESLFKFSFSVSGTGGEANGVNGAAGNYVITIEK